MMNKVTIKFAASTLAVALTMVGCTSSAEMNRPHSLASGSAKADQQANQFYARAQQAVQKGALAEALGLAERAVELSPRDAGYRMLLGDLYLKNGRFRSAETSFGDVLTLDPNNSRAVFSRALAQIGLGESAAALAQLEILSASAAPGDLGLAYALAGQPQRAVEMLERAAREPGADGRVRQNLALAYALSGNWQQARIIAAQDVSPAQLDARLRQWADFANPSATSNQLAAVLGVTKVEDGGQPVRLALAPAQSETTAFAAVEASPAFEASESEIASVAVEPSVVAVAPVAEQSAEAAPVPAVTFESEAQPAYAAAVDALVTPQPAVMRNAAATAPAPVFSAPASDSGADRKPVSARTGRFVVQLGAFSSPASVERAWAQAYRRYGFAGHQPLSTTIGIKGKGTFHRLSVAGFETRADASRTCRSVQAKGGACFVRAVAGDAPVRWAWRYTSPRA